MLHTPVNLSPLSENQIPRLNRGINFRNVTGPKPKHFPGQVRSPVKNNLTYVLEKESRALLRTFAKKDSIR